VIEAGALLDAGSDSDTAAAVDAPATFVPGWSVRKRLRGTSGDELVLEEVLASFLVIEPGANRVRSLARDRSWTAPTGSYVSDACRHPSGEVSAILIAEDGSVSLVRLDASLSQKTVSALHDSAVSTDPNAGDAGPTELVANRFPRDPARIAATGEDVIVAVTTSTYAVIAYRIQFANGAWGPPMRTLVEPPSQVIPFAPTSGTFNTFGAMWSTLRTPIDLDDQGAAYFAVWADTDRIRAHATVFGDGLIPLSSDPGDPLGLVGDIIVTKVTANGARAWSRVLGTPHEDEPYAIRAAGDTVAIVGRSRRLPGQDNTFWDVFIGSVTTDGSTTRARSIPFDASSIALAIDALPGAGWVIGGSDGWAQNPSGLSIVQNGTKLLFSLTDLAAEPMRWALPAGPRNNEIRTVTADERGVWYGGHEDGPIMHTGDSDLTQIHATGLLGHVPL